METVEMTRREYEAMIEKIEDLEDMISLIQFEDGKPETVPNDVVRRRVAGDNPLAIYREHRGLSQRALAAASGVNHVQIGDIERRGATGSIETLVKLARALDVTVENIANIERA